MSSDQLIQLYYNLAENVAIYGQTGQQRYLQKNIKKSQFHERKSFQNYNLAKDGRFSDPSLTLLHSAFNHGF